MIKGNLKNNIQTRRKSSMLQDSLSKIKYSLVLAVLLVLPMLAALPMQAEATATKIDQTDTGTNRIIAWYDTRGRESFVQVTNTSAFTTTIHVQLFDVGSAQGPCNHCNFSDTLSGFDTHVYNLQDMATNAVPSALPPIPSVPACNNPKTYGAIIISNTGDQNRPLIGMFRIVDELGYEYRANTAGEDPFPDPSERDIINYSFGNGNNLSDVVGIPYLRVDFRDVIMNAGVQAVFTNINSYDDVEFPTSCGDTIFACNPGQFDKGIDNGIPNSKGNIQRICPSMQLDLHNSAWLDIVL